MGINLTNQLTKDEKWFYSIEFTDLEGEINIKHRFMTKTEASQLLEEFRCRGIRATLYQISYPHDV